jgi:hypothetical protein
VARWIGLVNGFSNPVSKINKVEIYIYSTDPLRGKYILGRIYTTREAKGLIGRRSAEVGSWNDLTTADAPEFLNSKAGEILSTSSQ